MSRYWSALVHRLSPYVPGEQPRIEGLIKLNTNENPHGPSPRALAAIRAETNDSLRLYPDPDSETLRSAIAAHFGLVADEVFVGNGSDEVLAHVFVGLLKHEAPLLFPDITYSFYPVYCDLYGVSYRQIPLTESFEIRVADYAAPNGGIILPNPNAPTGRLLPLSDIERLLTANQDSAVVIDEAYVDFGGESAATLIARHPNLLVVQTFSKSRSLAGLRVGFAMGQKPLIEGLERVKNSFNSYPIDRLASAAAIAAMQDDEYFRQTCQSVVRTRDTLTADLQRLGFDVLPSAANFVFARHPGRDAAELATELRERRVIVRHFKRPRIDQFLRITIGTDAECEALVAALSDILRN